MLTPAQGKAQRRELMKSIANAERERQRAELADLRRQVREARAERARALVEARHACRDGRQQTRERIKAERARLIAEMRQRFKEERAQARSVCDQGLASARELAGAHERARAKLKAEKVFRADMRRIESQNRDRKRELARPRPRGEKASESDDQVRGNIPPELHALFSRVGRSIKGTDRMTRTEAFLHYAEEHPHEVLASIEHESEANLAALEQKERNAYRALHKALPRHTLTAAELAQEAPF